MTYTILNQFLIIGIQQIRSSCYIFLFSCTCALKFILFFTLKVHIWWFLLTKKYLSTIRNSNHFTPKIILHGHIVHGIFFFKWSSDKCKKISRLQVFKFLSVQNSKLECEIVMNFLGFLNHALDLSTNSTTNYFYSHMNYYYSNNQHFSFTYMSTMFTI